MVATQERLYQPSPPEPLLLLTGYLLTRTRQLSHSSHRDFVQANILDRRLDNREATGLSREDINLISTLPHITKQALDGVRSLNRSMHRLRKCIQGHEVLFILSQATHRCWIALSVLGFDGC